ncbi:MFS transporter [Streptomyces fuscichromogenes]|uniref:MFS transporter n=1 Tax=Streptomyces fuscichromogenes TaxID=1324013 RepID=A0A917XKG2_9ACTN|nr:MFS transporter [Streptomyces fuscichromogenes]GGN34819.1 MFS transporter [Streptomyces fuscichromogenes]
MIRRLSRVLPDLTPLRTLRDFRLLWFEGLVMGFGSSIALVAMPLQIKELTGSPFAVGLTGAVELVPLVVFGLYGGALADHVDRRRIIVLTESGLGVLACGLLVNSLLPHPALWPLYVTAALVSVLSGLQQPALSSLIARIVPHDQLTASAALNFASGQVSGILGPALAGIIVAWGGTSLAYGVALAALCVAVPLCLRLSPSPPARENGRPSFASLVEGARHAFGKPVLIGTYAMDIVAMFFAYPVTLFPFLANDLHAPWAVGMLFAAVPLGAMLVTVTSGWVSKVRRHGRLVALGAAGWGLAVALSGLTDRIWLVFACFVLAGALDMISGLARHTIWDQTVPDELRGRLAGIEVLSYSCGPQLGQLRAGTTASLIGTRASIWSGGVLCVAAVGALALALPRLLSYHADTDEDALHRKAQKEAPAGATGAEPRDAVGGMERQEAAGPL